MKKITIVVDKQLKAYNNADFEVFSSCYAKNIESYFLETNSRMDDMCGQDFFKYYEEKFKKNPELFCKVTERIVHDTLVIDKEYITACNDNNHTETVIYMVENELITKMWFSKEITEETK